MGQLLSVFPLNGYTGSAAHPPNGSNGCTASATLPPAGIRQDFNLAVRPFEEALDSAVRRKADEPSSRKALLRYPRKVPRRQRDAV